MYNSLLHKVWQYHSDIISYCGVYITWHCMVESVVISLYQDFKHPIIGILLLTCTCREWLNWTRGLSMADFYHLNTVCRLHPFALSSRSLFSIHILRCVSAAGYPRCSAQLSPLRKQKRNSVSYWAFQQPSHCVNAFQIMCLFTGTLWELEVFLWGRDIMR